MNEALVKFCEALKITGQWAGACGVLWIVGTMLWVLPVMYGLMKGFSAFENMAILSSSRTWCHSPAIAEFTLADGTTVHCAEVVLK